MDAVASHLHPQSVFSDLTTLCLDTADLALSYHHDLIAQQATAVEAKGKQKLGTLHVSVVHLGDKEMLEVRVFRAEGLPALDYNSEA